MSSGRLVILADQIAERGGTERLLEVILKAFPDALAYARAFDVGNYYRTRPDYLDSRVTIFDRARRRRSSFLVPLDCFAARRLDLRDAEIIVSVTQGGWPLSVRGSSTTRHLAFLTGPLRALWGHTEDYLDQEDLITRHIARVALPILRWHNQELVQRPIKIAVPSHYSAQRVAQIYGRESTILGVPIDTEFFTPSTTARSSFTVVARLVSHKRLQDVLDTFAVLDEGLRVVGTGPLLAKIQDMAGRNVIAYGRVDDFQLREIYRSSLALICPSVEEFGMVIAEAMACGTPVIARRAGAAVELISDEENGLLVDDFAPETLASAIARIRRTHASNGFVERCRSAVRPFGTERFLQRFRDWLAPQ